MSSSRASSRIWPLGFALAGFSVAFVAAEPDRITANASTREPVATVRWTDLQHVEAQREHISVEMFGESPFNPPPEVRVIDWLDTWPEDDTPDTPIAPRGTCIGPSRTPISSVQVLALADNNRSIPPDTMGAAGPNHIVTMLNTQVRIQTRAGLERGVVSLATFWSPLGGIPFDPKVIFDAAAGRWIATCDANARSANSRVYVAISATSDPTLSWTFYSIVPDDSGQSWSDYPGIGVNGRWLVISNNMFVVGGSGFVGSKLWVFDKASLLDGGSISLFTFATGFDQSGGVASSTMQPCVTHDDSESSIYLVDNPFLLDGTGRPLLRISQLSGATDAPTWSVIAGSTFANTGTFRVNNSFNPIQIDAAQPGTTGRIETNDPRILNAVYRNGRIWVTHTGGLPATGTVDRTGVMWYQLNPLAMPNPIVQSGTISGGSDTHHYFPSVDVNCAGDACIGFTRSGTARFAEAAYAFRRAADAPGTFGAVSTLKVGEDSYLKDFGSGRVRWGDYSATVVDPIDDRSFWTFQEYAETDVGPYTSDDRWGVWASRLLVLSNDCNGNGVSDTTDISTGTSADCNTNGAPDECDVALGVATDCDADGILDLCEVNTGEPDCNDNNVPDGCDVSTGNSPDCNANGVPDECDVLNGFLNDCNLNEIPDECELASGAGQDCNANNRLDICDLTPGTPIFGNTTTPYPRTPFAMTSADFDGGGNVEFAIADVGPVVDGDGRVRLMRWNGSALAIYSNANTGRRPRSIAAADFNNDGWTDVAVCAEGNPNPDVSVALNSGSGQLLPSIRYASGNQGNALLAADLNDDGWTDLFVSNGGGGQPTVLLNLGNGVFGAPQLIAAFLPTPERGVVTDVDLDGHADVVLALRDVDAITILRGRGDATFHPELRLGVGDNPVSVVAAHLNADGFPDLVTACNAESSVFVSVNRGDGSFAAAVRINVADAGASPSGVTVTDVNSDGVPDLATSLSASDLVSVSIGVGPSSYLPPTIVAAGDHPLEICAGDFDNDSDFDLVAVNQTGVTATVIRNFTQAPLSRDCNNNGSPDSCDIASGGSVDANADEIPDECTPDCNANGLPDSTDLADGTSSDCNGNLVPDECDTDCNGNSQPDSCDVRFGVEPDCDQDGIPDSCAPDCDENGIPDVCDFAPGPIAFQVASDPIIAEGVTSMASADIDGDGDIDLVCKSDSDELTVFFNAAGTFTPGPPIATLGFISDVRVVDLNLDMSADLLTGHSSGSAISIVLNSGNGAFLPFSSVSTSSAPWALDAGDIDADGDIDIVVGSYDSSSTSELRILRRSGAGYIQEATGRVFGRVPRALRLADIDDDGDPDVVALSGTDQQLAVFRNFGGGMFADALIVAATGEPSGIALEDLDGDTDLDAAVSLISNSNIAIFRNVGAGTFLNLALIPNGFSAEWIAAADFDLDGDTDLVASQFTTYACRPYRNDGNASFQAMAPVPLGIRPPRAALFAANGDGRLDIVAAGGTSTSDDRLVTALNTTAPPNAEDCNGNSIDDACEQIPGDVNGDGSVGLTDLSILLSNFGATGSLEYGQGNLDNDEDVDLSDLSVLLANFGRDCP